MDRFGLFVDAGYLLAAGGQLCVGEKQRDQFSCDHEGIHRKVVEFCKQQSQLPHLRTYWYGGAPGQPHPQPTTEQLRIAALPSVKLRLGRIIRGQQKGVDSMITRDLMTLARERAMAIAYLVAGDEDLREAVVAAQDLGVQVVLLGVTPVPGVTNQSFTLINECDSNVVFDKESLVEYFSTAVSEPILQMRPLFQPGANVADARSEEEVADDLGRSFCDSWFEREGVENGRLLVPRLPELTKDVDGELLRSAEAAFGSLRQRESLRKRVRQAFVLRLKGCLDDAAVQEAREPSHT
jgi:uncharacterized LabA/DUF88 family protein